MVKAAVIGLGYWGPNLVRNLASTSGVDLVTVCDLKETRLEAVGKNYPAVTQTADSREVMADENVDAVVIATPTNMHYPLAKAALEAGKHVWVEKPITDNVAHAEELVDLAARKGLVLMVDHTFVYHPAVEKIHDVIQKGELGDVYYYDSVRINLGLFQPDVSVLWDLASHDVSIMDHLIHQTAVSVQATGACHAGARVESMAYVTIQHDGGALGHCHVNWLAPTKIRLVMIGGSRRMVVYDDNNVSEKVKIYDKGVDIKNVEGCYEAMVQYRTGEMHAPALDRGEALKRETQHFVHCITNGSTPLTDGRAGLRVVRILSAAQQSIAEHGKMIPL
jgi:predicted dehydrogenase